MHRLCHSPFLRDDTEVRSIAGTRRAEALQLQRSGTAGLHMRIARLRIDVRATVSRFIVTPRGSRVTALPSPSALQ